MCVTGRFSSMHLCTAHCTLVPFVMRDPVKLRRVTPFVTVRMHTPAGARVQEKIFQPNLGFKLITQWLDCAIFELGWPALVVLVEAYEEWKCFVLQVLYFLVEMSVGVANWYLLPWNGKLALTGCCICGVAAEKGLERCTQDSGGKRIGLGFMSNTCEDPPKMELEVLQRSSFLFLS